MEAFRKLSPARFVVMGEFERVFAERTAQGLLLHPIWHEHAASEPDAEDDEQGP